MSDLACGIYCVNKLASTGGPPDGLFFSSIYIPLSYPACAYFDSVCQCVGGRFADILLELVNILVLLIH
jgi:hypothetical protein